MGKQKKKNSVASTYAFGLTWLICSVVFDLGFFKCLLLAWGISWLVGYFTKKEKPEPKVKKEPAAEPLQPKPQPKPEEKPQPKPEPEKTTGDPELDALIRNGRESVAKLQQINDDIPDFKVSAQLKQIEILTATIIDQVEKKPDKRKEVRQFMDYYLPTTIKLLEKYVQMQNVGMKGENITSGMQQVEELLDKVIVAFQKQLDSLFERDVVDITADIQVMEQMMAAQGLTDKKDF